jgi:HKD family nuclease
MLEKGIYENIINEELRERIDSTEFNDLVCLRSEVDSAESSQMLADYLAKVIKSGLERVEDYKDRVELANKVLEKAGLLDEGIKIVDSEKVLTQVMTQQQFAMQQQAKTETIRPLSGFRVSNLFTGGNSSLSLGEEIRREIASADEICLIVSFLRLSGVRIIIDDLRKFCEREGSRLRIITTTYCGVTESKAIKELASLPNTEIKISYNTEFEHLHAKAYIFVRNSGMNTAYIGSSNLSKSAQTEGLEWNMRVTSVENPHIIKTALATFDIYWNSPNFEDFRIGGIEKFNKEINRNTFHGKNQEQVYHKYMLLPHQKQILDKLRVEREERNNYRNLIVAATGTGRL